MPEGCPGWACWVLTLQLVFEETQAMVSRSLWSNPLPQPPMMPFSPTVPASGTNLVAEQIHT